MEVLVFDPFHGAAGDMILGALLDCGADRNLVIKAMKSVAEEPKIRTVTRCGIKALKVETRAKSTRRTFKEVLARCDDADAPTEARSMAKRVFSRIGAAEERVHGTHSHFHEIGADDAIADVIGSCTAIISLGIDGVAVLPIMLGKGSRKGSHGTYPVPAPATLYILENTGIATQMGNEDGEFCTPTGAALLSEFVTVKEQEIVLYTIRSVGYGAGTRDTKNTPNVLRALIIETVSAPMLQDIVDVLETNVDDVSGEVIAHTISQLMDSGARDVSAIPSIMKKGRPGYLIRLICTQDKSIELAALMAREIGTLGIRCTPTIHRFIAERKEEDVDVVINGKMKTISIKCGLMGGKVFTLKPEFEQARAWAEELGISLRDVLQTVTEVAWKAVRQRYESSDEK